MSDEGAQPQAESGDNNQAQVRLERMYLKDASFESPNSPSVFQSEWQPEIDLQVNTRSEQVVPSLFEVVITVTVTAKLGEKTAFITEVQYAGLFRLGGLPDDLAHRTLGTFCPNTLFPYVREAVDSLVVSGGFPPLRLMPINFEMAYEQALRQAQEQAQAASGSPTTH